MREPKRFLVMELADDEISQRELYGLPRPKPQTRQFRKFVVMEPGAKPSKCLPVTTFEHQSALWPAVRSRQHQIGIIHSTPKPPNPLSGETGLRPAIQVELNDRSEALSSEMRIDYGMPIEVRHDHKVYILGNVTKKSLPTLRSNFQSVAKPKTSTGPNPPRPPASKPTTANHPRSAAKPPSRPAKPTTKPAKSATKPTKHATKPAKPAKPPPQPINPPPTRPRRHRHAQVLLTPAHSNAPLLVTALLDTGADDNLMDERTARHFRRQSEPYRGPGMCGVGGGHIQPLCNVRCRWRFADVGDAAPVHYTDVFTAVDRMLSPREDVIIGDKTITERGLLQWTY